MGSWRQYYQSVYPAVWRQQVKKYGFGWYQQAMLDLLCTYSHPGEEVLEVGIGTGEGLALRLARLGRRVYGIDISPDLLQDCRGVFAEANLCPLVVAGCASHVPLRSEMFDLVYLYGTTWYLPDLSCALAEAARVLRPGRHLIFDVMNACHITPLSGYLYNQAKHCLLGRPPSFWKPTTPWAVSRTLAALGLKWQVKGFYVFLPSNLPIIGDRLALVTRSHLASYGLQDSLLRFLGSKLLYICRKPSRQQGE